MMVGSQWYRRKESSHPRLAVLNSCIVLLYFVHRSTNREIKNVTFSFCFFGLPDYQPDFLFGLDFVNAPDLCTKQC